MGTVPTGNAHSAAAREVRAGDATPHEETTVQRYRKRPVEIEAMQVTVDAAGWPSADVAAWCGGRATRDAQGARIAIDTLEGTMDAQPGDWIIQGVKGEFYPCKPDIFEQTYDAVEPTDAR